MSRMEKVATYFATYGAENTKHVIAAVLRKVEEENVETVVVASTSGATGVEFAKALQGKGKVVAVSYEAMKPELKNQIEKLGAVALEKTHLPLHEKGMDDIRNTLYTLGQGFKVAVEVILIAADKAAITLYEDVIGVGGTGEGADTAILARATPTKEMFSKDEKKKLEVREIIAMPHKKKWW
ncbi:MAG: pyruvate kinase alpha/beta domain-containing protein [Candidatus Bathyarchaeia archaeon]